MTNIENREPLQSPTTSLSVKVYRDLLRVEASCQCLRTLVTGHQLYRASYLRLCHQQVLLCRCILFYVSQYIYTGETFVVGKVTQSIHLGDESLLGRRYWPWDRTSGFKFAIKVVIVKISSFEHFWRWSNSILEYSLRISQVLQTESVQPPEAWPLSLQRLIWLLHPGTSYIQGSAILSKLIT